MHDIAVYTLYFSAKSQDPTALNPKIFRTGRMPVVSLRLFWADQ